MATLKNSAVSPKTLTGFIFRQQRIILIVLLGLLIYSNTFHAAFHFDDEQNILSNPAIRSLWNLKAVWNFAPTRFFTYLSLAINYHFHQLSLPGYHLFNLAIHLGASLLVSWFALLLLSTPAIKDSSLSRHAKLISLLAGLIFVAHPIQTQAVTYIIQRTASLATFFYLLSVCLYLRARLNREQPPGSPGWLRPYAGSILAALAALFTKETAFTLPFMLLLCEVSFFRNSPKKIIKQLAPFFLLLFLVLITIKVTGWSTKFADMRNLKEFSSGLTAITPAQYLFTQFRVVVTYIRLLFFPVNQNLDYDYPIAQTLWQAPTIISLIFIALILASAVLLFRKHRILAFSIFWFFLALVPESSIIPIRDVIFEHRLYLPMAGFSIFLPVACYYLFSQIKIPRFFSAVPCILSTVYCILFITLGYSLLTYTRNRVWKDDVTLWSDVVRKSPNKARALFNLAGAWGDTKNFDRAIFYYNRVMELNQKETRVYFGRGLAYGKKGDHARAIADFTRAIEINPNYIDAYQNRAVAYRKEGKNDLSAVDYAKAIKLLNNTSQPNLFSNKVTS
jgi:tetratricopeptide (TPR) repeat protein